MRKILPNTHVKNDRVDNSIIEKIERIEAKLPKRTVPQRSGNPISPFPMYGNIKQRQRKEK